MSEYRLTAEEKRDAIARAQNLREKLTSRARTDSDPLGFRAPEPARPVGGDTREKGRLVLGVVGEMPDGPDLGTSVPAGPTDAHAELLEVMYQAGRLWAEIVDWPAGPGIAAIAAALAAERRDALAAQETLRRVTALHRPVHGPYGMACKSCIGSDEELMSWPCPTGQALAGDS